MSLLFYIIMMKRPPKPVKQPDKPPDPVKEVPPPTDCLTCVHHSAWKYNLIECKYRVCPQPNCKDNNITCVNYKIAR